MQLYLSSGAYFLRNEVICTEELKNEELKMCSTAKSTIAIGIHRNDVFCHAELAPIAIGTASLPNDKDSVPMVIGIHRNDGDCCTDMLYRVPTS